MNKSIKKLLTMLTYKRPEGSAAQVQFNNRFILPMMGKPDKHGNFICKVQDGVVTRLTLVSDVPKNSIAFMAHHDTVHRTSGIQSVYVSKENYAYVNNNECLGADCTTGVWLILEMIRNRIDGVYVIHTGEECGGIGSSALVKDKPKWLKNVSFAISFDRFGEDSIITHQSFMRCCSDKFAEDLASILNLNFTLDSGGVYTDSYEYVHDVPECTNISVGYYNQHKPTESQDLTFASKLLDSLLKADWSKLKAYRNPNDLEFYDAPKWTNKPNNITGFKSKFDSDYYGTNEDDIIEELASKYSSVERIIEAFPYEVADILLELGYDKRTLLKDITGRSIGF